MEPPLATDTEVNIRFTMDWNSEINMLYWPSLFGQDGWILAFLWTETPKITRPIFSRLDRTSLVNKEFIICPKTKSFLFWSTRKIPSGQDGPILKVAMRGEKTLKIASEQIKNIIWSTSFFIISYNWCIVTHLIFASCYVRVTLIKIAKFVKLQCRENFRL